MPFGGATIANFLNQSAPVKIPQRFETSPIMPDNNRFNFQGVLSAVPFRVWERGGRLVFGGGAAGFGGGTKPSLWVHEMESGTDYGCFCGGMEPITQVMTILCPKNIGIAG
uniref:Hydantoinase_B domain-containing protein n=1 Tax=Bursaphelenchus xylophilus TaxID=6326 RepID=A0A1I7RIV7_BURXY